MEGWTETLDHRTDWQLEVGEGDLYGGREVGVGEGDQTSTEGEMWRWERQTSERGGKDSFVDILSFNKLIAKSGVLPYKRGALKALHIPKAPCCV